MKLIKENSITLSILLKNVKKTVNKFNMLNKSDRVLISVSGGPDSTFLTYFLYYLKSHMDLKLFAFHLDHMTRDGQSQKDAIFVENLCKKLNIKLFKKKLDVGKWCKKNKLTFQEGARKLRMKMLLEISREHDIDKIALGHNADDNLETFFMRLIRGTGVRGLGAIKPAAGKFIRPLIGTFRKDIIKFLDENSLPYCIDRTNLEDIYFRNKIRNVLIPFIKENFSKNFEPRIINTIELLRIENDFLEKYSKDRFYEVADIKKNSENNDEIYLVKICAERLNKFHESIKTRVIFWGVEKIKGSLEDINYKNIKDIIGILNPGGEKKIIDLSREVKVIKENKYIYIVDKSKINKKQKLYFLINKKNSKFNDYDEKEKEIKIGGKEVCNDFDIEIMSKVLNISGKEFDFKKITSKESYLDYDKIKFPVKVRTWKKGDKFCPLGMKKEKKLHDFFIDCKIPEHLRKLIPIFVDSEKIIWVGGYRIDGRVKITYSTDKVLYLKIVKKRVV